MKPLLTSLFAVVCLAFLPTTCFAQSPVVEKMTDSSFTGSPIVTKPTRLKRPQDGNEFSLQPPVKQTRNQPRNQPLRPQEAGSTSTQTLPPKKNKQISSSSRPKSVPLETCFVKLIEDIEIPAEESGKLINISAQPGDRVSKNQMVAQMDDQRSRRMLEEATLKYRSSSRLANDDTEIKSAHKKYVLAKREYEDIFALYKKGSESKQAWQRSRYAMQISELDLIAAKNKKNLASLNSAAEQVRVNAANDSIERNAIRSPVNGIVFEVFKDGGEWATAGEKILRIARMDRLRIQGFVEGSQFDPHEVANKPVTVTLEMARESFDFSGQIVFVSLEKGGNRYRVWAEVDNIEKEGRWVLQADGEVSMTIHLDRNASSVTKKRNPQQTLPR